MHFAGKIVSRDDEHCGSGFKGLAVLHGASDTVVIITEIHDVRAVLDVDILQPCFNVYPFAPIPGRIHEMVKA